MDLNGQEPTYVLDTNGDGEDDCAVYVYHYTKRVRRRGFVQTTNIYGKVYIFYGISREDFENMDQPKGFNKSSDLLILDETSGSNPSMYALQAQHIWLRNRRYVIKCMQQYDEDYQTAWDRSDSSLDTEWIAHNACAPLDKSAQNIDFDNGEEGFTLWNYFQKAVNRGIEKYF